MIGKTRVSTELDAFKWAKPVHRLDAATSGLLILSKTLGVHQQMAKCLKNEKSKKLIMLLSWGVKF